MKHIPSIYSIIFNFRIEVKHMPPIIQTYNQVNHNRLLLNQYVD